MERLFAQLDSRRRISLGKLAKAHATYQAEVFPNGTIILTPADTAASTTEEQPCPEP